MGRGDSAVWSAEMTRLLRAQSGEPHGGSGPWLSLPWLIVEPCIRHARLNYCSQRDEVSAVLYVPSSFLEAVARNQTEQPALVYGGFYFCSWVK